MNNFKETQLSASIGSGFFNFKKNKVKSFKEESIKNINFREVNSLFILNWIYLEIINFKKYNVQQRYDNELYHSELNVNSSINFILDLVKLNGLVQIKSLIVDTSFVDTKLYKFKFQFYNYNLENFINENKVELKNLENLTNFNYKFEIADYYSCKRKIPDLKQSIVYYIKKEYFLPGRRKLDLNELKKLYNEFLGKFRSAHRYK